MATQTVMTMESDSVDDDEASTTDDVDSSRQWTTDDLEAGDSDAPTSGGKTTGTSNDEAEREDNETYRKSNNSLTPEQDHHQPKPSTYPPRHRRHHNSKEQRRKRSNAKSAGEGNDGEEKKAQSDTETKNLLGDVDFDDDNPDTDLGGNLSAANHRPETEANMKIFELTEEQTRYYTSCFLHLMEKSQGVASPTGALNGADPCILEFFRKSGLDNIALSKIWALSDVNEDGFLNHSEFCVAMHLIVLHLKAKVPIPTKLPSRVRPPLTPTRQLVTLADGRYYSSVVAVVCSDGTTSTSASSSTHTAAAALDMVGMIGSENTSNSRGSNNSNAQQLNSWSLVNGTSEQLAETSAFVLNIRNNNQPQFSPQVMVPTMRAECAVSVPTPSAKHHSLSDDHLHIYAAAHGSGEQPGGAAVVAQFSNIPPLLVDSQPMALNASDALASLHTSMITRGPPPQPPFRAYHHQQQSSSTTGAEGKGHGRSASLDLKTFVSLSSYPRKSPHLTNQIAFPIAVHPGTAPTTSSSQLSTLFQPSEGQKSCVSKATQTDNECASLRNESYDCVDMFDSSGVPSLQERCVGLQRLNEQLENERTTLSQVRLQLQIRIDEMQAQMAALKTTKGSSQVAGGRVDKERETATSGQCLNKPTSI